MLDGDKIKKARGIISPEIYAKKLGIKRNYLLDLEAGRRQNPTLRVLMALKKASKMPIDYFVKSR
jgi:transcriptional regulator with XRE-family HTH domain